MSYTQLNVVKQHFINISLWGQLVHN